MNVQSSRPSHIISTAPVSPAAESVTSIRLRALNPVQMDREAPPTLRMMPAARPHDAHPSGQRSAVATLGGTPLPAEPAPTPLSRRYYTIEEAAGSLGMTPEALMARVRRAARQGGADVIKLGSVVACRVGPDRWLIALPDHPQGVKR
jgi:hypothetical protein